MILSTTVEPQHEVVQLQDPNGDRIICVEKFVVVFTHVIGTF